MVIRIAWLDRLVVLVGIVVLFRWAQRIFAGEPFLEPSSDLAEGVCGPMNHRLPEMVNASAITVDAVFNRLSLVIARLIGIPAIKGIRSRLRVVRIIVSRLVARHILVLRLAIVCRRGRLIGLSTFRRRWRCEHILVG